MGTHAILSPSSAHRWLACPPSARFEEQLPDEESVYAQEGTLAHDLAALLLSRIMMVKERYTVLLEDLQSNPLYSKEMMEHCEGYVEYVQALAGDSHVYVEQKYDMSMYIPLQHGTADASFIKGGKVYVVDFKYGAGVRVTATGNKQMMCYGLGAYAKHTKGNTLEAVHMSIYQPRAGGASSWDLPVKDLLQWAEEEARPKGELAISGQGDFKAGDHCQFCKARTICKAYYDVFASVKGLYDKRTLTDDERKDVLTNGKAVATWVDAVKSDATKTLQNGGKVSGFKLVAGRGKRTFKNEDDVIEILVGEDYGSEQIFDTKLKSLTSIKKLVGPKTFKELFNDEIMTVPGGPVLAPEDDERQPVGTSAADEYDEEI